MAYAPAFGSVLTNQAVTSPQARPAAPRSGGITAAPLAGAALQVGGALQQIQGSRAQQDAMRNALGGYESALSRFYGGQRGAGMQDIQQANAISQQRLAALQNMLGGYTQQGFDPASNVAGIQSTVQQAQQGGPQLGDVSMRSGATQNLQNRLGDFYGQRQRQQAAVLGNQLAWGQQGVGQNQAMSNFAISDQDVQNRLAQMNRLAMLRDGADARTQAQIEQDAARAMAGAQGVGGGNQLAGGIMQAAGSLFGSGI